GGAGDALRWTWGARRWTRTVLSTNKRALSRTREALSANREGLSATKAALSTNREGGPAGRRGPSEATCWGYPRPRGTSDRSVGRACRTQLEVRRRGPRRAHRHRLCCGRRARRPSRRPVRARRHVPDDVFAVGAQFAEVRRRDDEQVAKHLWVDVAQERDWTGRLERPSCGLVLPEV